MASIAPMEPTTPRDLTRTTLAVLLLGGLLTACFWILRPFLAPLVWAALLTIACWPALLGLQRRLGNRRGVAVAVMMTALVLLFVVPVTLLLAALIGHAPELASGVREILKGELPAPPAWVASVPLVGARASALWADLVAAGPEGLAARVAPYAEQLAGWFVAQAGNAGLLFFHFLLTLVLASVLFAKGELFATGVRSFARRLAGERGDRAAVLAAQGVRAVAIGVVVTALAQALLGGLGLFIAGVPVAGLLTAIMFVAALAQVGAAPVLALAAIWLFWHDSTGWGIAMLVWTVIVGGIDNVIRPLTIRRGFDLPLLLLFAGVVGGLIGFGPVGLFVGPVVLAVSYTLLTAWVGDADAAASDRSRDPAVGQALADGT